MEGSSTMIRLTNNNWQIWKSKMEDILYCKDLYEPVEGDSAKPKEMAEADWIKLNRKAVGTIRQWLDDSVYHHVASEKSAHELWKKLESLYEQKTAVEASNLVIKTARNSQDLPNLMIPIPLKRHTYKRNMCCLLLINVGFVKKKKQASISNYPGMHTYKLQKAYLSFLSNLLRLL
ncbi:uncharacterized protein LOC124944484 [Impatiens glandulifera]|uniref:uncharacterized protein LOC124944484 n=1 Tax=Impatiens glandulifera TaxID=253017 RepID=UPI001FB0BCBF|nr:uncharacterized protein LOC124944484 [Impatiens glandulifera]